MIVDDGVSGIDLMARWLLTFQMSCFESLVKHSLYCQRKLENSGPKRTLVVVCLVRR